MTNTRGVSRAGSFPRVAPMKQRAITMANRPRVPTCDETIVLGRALRCICDPEQARAWRLWLNRDRDCFRTSPLYRARVMLLLRCSRGVGPE